MKTTYVYYIKDNFIEHKDEGRGGQIKIISQNSC